MKNYLVTFTSNIEVEAENEEDAYDAASDLFGTGEGYSDVEIEEII